jgi:hypothetical protein
VKQLKISMGIWGNTNLPDRFHISGVSDFVPVVDRIREVGEIQGVDGPKLAKLVRDCTRSVRM